MSTIEPDWIEGGSNIEGNSICGTGHQWEVVEGEINAHQSFVSGEKDSNTGVDFADS